VTRALALVALTVLAVASALGVVGARHDARVAFGELVALEAERDELNVDFGRLQLEQATWAETNRIEQIASGELRMVHPDPATTRIVRR